MNAAYWSIDPTAENAATFPKLVGKTIAAAAYTSGAADNGMVVLTFTDGTTLSLYPWGMAGCEDAVNIRTELKEAS